MKKRISTLTAVMFILFTFVGCNSNGIFDSYYFISVTLYNTDGNEIESSDISRYEADQKYEEVEKLEKAITGGEEISLSHDTFENEQKYRLIYANVSGLKEDGIDSVYYDVYLHQNTVIYEKLVKDDSGYIIPEGGFKIAKDYTADDFFKFIEKTKEVD